MADIEFAFAFIKPDGMASELKDRIRGMLLASGKLTILAEAKFSITPLQAKVHYDKDDLWCKSVGTRRHEFIARRFGGVSKTPMELGREILSDVRGTIVGAPVYAFILYGENANAVLREIVGATDPEAAEEGTIRKLSSDSLALANEEMRPVRNIIHASESPNDAKREILNLWPEIRQLMQFLLF